jgi:hypothetical protein
MIVKHLQTLLMSALIAVIFNLARGLLVTSGGPMGVPRPRHGLSGWDDKDISAGARVMEHLNGRGGGR